MQDMLHAVHRALSTRLTPFAALYPYNPERFRRTDA